MVALTALTLLLASSCGANAQSSSQTSEPGPPANLITGTLAPLEVAPASAKQVHVGMYVINAYDLSLSSNTYYLSGYLWLRWLGDFDPLATLEFTNAVEEWGLMRTNLYEEPQVLPDGSNYQIMRIQGRFFQPFDLRDYPLDKQELALFVENSTDTTDKMVYVPDQSSTGYDAGLTLPGWDLKGLSTQMLAHDYGTNFGQTGGTSTYSALKFSLQLDRVKNLFVWKLLLPLVIVLLTNWLALLLNPTMIEVRTAMPATALLTMVFLQQASLDAIPQVSTLVLMDLIYMVAYVFIILTFALIIWVNNTMVKDDPVSVARMRKIDLVSAALQITAASLLIGMLIWQRI